MDSTRDQVKNLLMSWLDNYLPTGSEFMFDGLVLIWLGVFSLLLHVFLHVFLRRSLLTLAEKKGGLWQKALLENTLFHRISYTIQGVVVHLQAGIWFEEETLILQLVQGISTQWILLFGLLSLFSALDSFQSVIYKNGSHIRFPFRGLIQTIKLISSLFVGLLAVAALIGKSPLILLSGLGAISAVLLLVFRDSILGLVAGIQLSANQMLSVGDWLEMPKYGADGDVIDIALTTVKVQNWDNTITTIPAYALISDSFKNWRGMTESGGRRIRRSLQIDTNSIRFIDAELFERLSKAELLGDYLPERQQEIEQENAKKNSDLSVLVNGRRLTNIGTFRQYLVNYLKNHPNIHQNMTLMVRQLQSTAEGLPIEIYAFTNTTSWVAYENIQSDIFDHIFATLPEFDLRIHEAPTGHDIQALRSTQKI
jgi:miniconductance mechanosensitive channel